MERENTDFFYESLVTNDVEEALRRIYLKLLFFDSLKCFEPVPDTDNLASIERTMVAIQQLEDYKNGYSLISFHDSREEFKLYRDLHSLEVSLSIII